MADVCIIYATADAREIPAALEEELSDTWSIWWANKIPSGDYREHIERELPKAACVIPIWSSHARISRVLHDELEIAKSSGVPILPIRIEDVRPPLGFGVDNSLDILGWTGERGRGEISELRTRITKTIDDRRASLRRPEDLGLGSPSKLPAFFFSISSHNTRLSPTEALKALDVFGAKPILVSAYDLAETRRTKEMVRRLKRQRKKDSI
ncbi:toll/interleukin-1 receptor domain-containing protein, partial [Bradyrhizobium sp. AS23.2]|uniref:toll/interleukin-1 receptor domain-containing protein n=1 Tax=Bradyrhizobium sp. AS23.2 TaxID=1680155 RepID=UPI0011611B3A